MRFNKISLLSVIASFAGMLSAKAYSLPRIGYMPGGSLPSGSGDGVIVGVTSLIQGIANGLAIVAASLAVLFIVINAGRLMISFGKSEDIQKARKSLLWSVLGLFAIIFAYIIVKSIIALVYSGE